MNGECVPKCTPGQCTAHEVCKLGQCYPNCRELGCPEGQRCAPDAICEKDNQPTPSARCTVKTDCLGNLPDCCYGYCTSLESSDVDCGVCGNNCLAQGKTCENRACVVPCLGARSLRVGDTCVCPPPTLDCQNECCGPDQYCCDTGHCCPTGLQCCGDDCCDPNTEQCFPSGDPLNGIKCCGKDRLCSGGCCQPDEECADDGTCQPKCSPACTTHQTCCHRLGVNYCRSPSQLCNEKCCGPQETCALVKNNPDQKACCPSGTAICGGVCCDAGEGCGPNGQCTVIPYGPDLCPPSCACCTVETVECGNKQLLGYTLPDGQPAWRCVAVGKLCPNVACGGGQTCCGPGDDGRSHCCTEDRFCCNGQCCPLADSCCPDAEHGLPHGTCMSPARLLVSPSNCGKCGNKCPPHTACRGGECK